MYNLYTIVRHFILRISYRIRGRPFRFSPPTVAESLLGVYAVELFSNIGMYAVQNSKSYCTSTRICLLYTFRHNVKPDGEFCEMIICIHRVVLYALPTCRDLENEKRRREICPCY